MRLRRLLVGVLAAIGATVVIDRLLTAVAGPLPPAMAGRSARVRRRAANAAIVERGDRSAPTVVLVHGPYLGASAREFADLAAALSPSYHVVAVDLLGFGRSDRPRVSYDIDRLGDALAGVLGTLDDGATVVTSGQSLAVAAVASRQVAIDRIVAIAPRTERPTSTPVVAGILSTPLLGRTLRLWLTSRSSLARHLASELECDPDRLDPSFERYSWQSAHQPGSPAASTAYLGGDLDARGSLSTVVGALAPEIAFVVGERAHHPRPETVRSVAEDVNASVSIVSDTGGWAHLTAADALAEHLDETGLLT